MEQAAEQQAMALLAASLKRGNENLNLASDEHLKQKKKKKKKDTTNEEESEAQAEVDSAEPSSPNSEIGSESGDEGSYSFGDGSDNDEGYSASSGDAEEEDAGDVADKFAEGFNAYRAAFTRTIETKVSDDALGPVLSANKTLIAKRLDEANIVKAKTEAKKEKRMLKEKGHTIPEKVLDANEKSLIRIATKGVVKLFNAVSKAQSVQSGVDVSKLKHAKVARKQSKAAFLKELKRNDQPRFLNFGPNSLSNSKKDAVGGATGGITGEVSGWAVLQDNFMHTSSKLKDWDKMPQTDKVEDDLDMTGRDVEDNDSFSD